MALQKALFPLRVVLRSQEIWVICAGYGLTNFLTGLGIQLTGRGLKFAGLSQKTPLSLNAEIGKRLALTAMRLGPTFIKLGQVLSTRPDLIGEPMAGSLSVLLDNVEPVPFGAIENVLRKELGKKTLRKEFKSIDPKPIASASIAQVHRATLQDGTPVVLKVQKPGANITVRTDLTLLEGLAYAANAVNPSAGILQAFKDFKSATLREIDYREEAKNIDRFRKNHTSVFSKAKVVFPGYIPQFTTRRVIALELMQGQKVAGLTPHSTVARKAAAQSVVAILEQIFEHGFFHADPHAGNLFFLEDTGQLAFIDLGLVGQLQNKDRIKFIRVLMAVLTKDRRKLARAIFELGEPSKATVYDAFAHDIDHLIDELSKYGIAQIKLEATLDRLLAIAKRHRITIPNRYLLMLRSCLLMEGVARQLDPHLSIASIAAPVLMRSLVKAYSPLHWIFRRIP